MLHLQSNLCLPPIHELLSSKAYSHGMNCIKRNIVDIINALFKDTSSEKVKLAPLHNHHNNNDDAATNVISTKERAIKGSNTSSPPPQPIHPSSISDTRDYNYLPFSMENLALSSPSISVCNSSNNTYQHRRSFSDTALMQTNNDPLRIIYRVSPSPPPSSSSTSTTMTPTMGLKRSPSQPQRRYMCHYCDKSFIRPSSLRTHTYSHTGQKPFECAFEGCDKRFSVLSNMRRHMRRHRPSSSSSPASQE